MTDRDGLPAASAPLDETFEIWDGYSFDLEHRTLTLSGRHLPTSDKEFALALLLFRNLSNAISRDFIMMSVWGYGPGEPTRTLDVSISQLRTRLGLRPKNGLLLTAVYRFGYRLERLSTWESTPRGLDPE